MTDAGMCGDYDSVIGMDKAEPLNRFLRKLPVEKFKPAEGGPRCAAWRSIPTTTGLALAIAPLRSVAGCRRLTCRSGKCAGTRSA